MGRLGGKGWLLLSGSVVLPSLKAAVKYIFSVIEHLHSICDCKCTMVGIHSKSYDWETAVHFTLAVTNADAQVLSVLAKVNKFHL